MPKGLKQDRGQAYCVLTPLSEYFNYILVVSFIGELVHIIVFLLCMKKINNWQEMNEEMDGCLNYTSKDMRGLVV
jgi:hypothetical protein